MRSGNKLYKFQSTEGLVPHLLLLSEAELEPLQIKENKQNLKDLMGYL